MEFLPLILDIDLFKQVNDRHGHEVGDHVLKALAMVCERAMRRIDILGRLGGEEFAVLLPDADAALEAAERLRQAIADAPLALDTGTRLGIPVSIGVATLDATEADTRLGELLRHADAALNRFAVDAKRISGNLRTTGRIYL